MVHVYDIAQQVRDWLTAGHGVTVAVLVDVRGFSSSTPGASAAWRADGAPVGDPLAARAAGLGHGLVEVTLDDAAAHAAGLACGGTARILVGPDDAFPDQLWDRLLAREPVCLVTRPHGEGVSPTELVTPETIHTTTGDVARLFGRGVTLARVVAEAPLVVAAAFWPVPTLVVVGDGLIAGALHDAATLLGWPTEVRPDLVDGAGLRPGDAVLVLSHDRAVDGPALTAALASRAGYVGALGSRRTQQLRRDWLTEHGVPADAQARIHGPAGLDIDAHTPAEIAVSIVAEILASRGASGAGALRDRSGPVHLAGVQAPPPRYSS